MKVEKVGKVKTSSLPKVNKHNPEISKTASYIAPIGHGGACPVDVLDFIRESDLEQEEDEE